MRPVNLIPLAERRGQNAPLRSGPLVYVVLGALLAVLAGVTALVLVGNQVSDRKSELAQAEQEDAVATAQVARLSSYTQFRSLSEQRVATVASLADSRFDWERVLRELALVLPRDVWLVNLTGTVAPGVTLGEAGGGSEGGDLRAAAPGPALELSGCAAGQEAVAGFVTALKDIDGVTRVGVQSSELAEEQTSEEGNSGSGSDGASGDDCRTRNFIAKFGIVAAFDAAPISPVAGAEEVPAVAPEPTETSTETSESDEG